MVLHIDWIAIRSSLQLFSHRLNCNLILALAISHMNLNCNQIVTLIISHMDLNCNQLVALVILSFQWNTRIWQSRLSSSTGIRKWEAEGIPKKKGNKQTSKTHEEEETNLAPIHYVQCGMEAESTCQCQSLSSKHREIHHDLHKMGSGTYRKEEWVWRQIEIHHDLVSGTEKEILGPKINYWELWSRLTPAGGEEEVQWHVEPPPILASVRAAPHPFQKTLAAVSLVHSKKNSDALASLATCLLLVSSFDGCNKSCVVRVWGSSSFQGFVRYLLHCLGSWSPMCKNHKKQTMVGLGFQGSFLLLGSSDSGISAAEGAEETEVS